MRPIALVGLGLASACAPGALAAGPRIVSAGADAGAELNRALALHVTASPRDERLQGLRVSFPDLGGVFAESACRLGPARADLAEATPDSFAVRYRPAWAGLHLLEIAVTSGGCGEPTGTSRRSLALEVGGGATTADAALASASPKSPAPATACAGADLLPLRSRLRALRLALVCLVNGERRASGVGALRSTAALRRVAIDHVNDMRLRAYVGHARPGGPGLRGRLRRAGVRTEIAGENLGVAPGRLGTPRSIVAAWMASDPLRRNLLDPTFRTIGVAAVASVPGVVVRSGGTYAVELSR